MKIINLIHQDIMIIKKASFLKEKCTLSYELGVKENSSKQILIFKALNSLLF